MSTTRPAARSTPRKCPCWNALSVSLARIPGMSPAPMIAFTCTCCVGPQFRPLYEPVPSSAAIACVISCYSQHPSDLSRERVRVLPRLLIDVEGVTTPTSLTGWRHRSRRTRRHGENLTPRLTDRVHAVAEDVATA